MRRLREGSIYPPSIPNRARVADGRTVARNLCGAHALEKAEGHAVTTDQTHEPSGRPQAAEGEPAPPRARAAGRSAAARGAARSLRRAALARGRGTGGPRAVHVQLRLRLGGFGQRFGQLPALRRRAGVVTRTRWRQPMVATAGRRTPGRPRRARAAGPPSAPPALRGAAARRSRRPAPG